jgi:hypothetical protein
MTISPNLPEISYAYEDGVGLVAIKRGERGYHPVPDYPNADKDLAERMNERLGVTPEQAKAMMAGSLFGWHIPAADPATYERK